MLDLTKDEIMVTYIALLSHIEELECSIEAGDVSESDLPSVTADISIARAAAAKLMTLIDPDDLSSDAI